MPTNRTRRKKGRKSDLSSDQLQHLISGNVLDGPEPRLGGIDRHGFPMPFRDDDHRRQMWIENRDYIMGLEGQEVTHPQYFWSDTNSEGRRVYFLPGEMPAAARDYEV